MSAYVCSLCEEPVEQDGVPCPLCGATWIVPASYLTGVRLVARWDARDAARGLP